MMISSNFKVTFIGIFLPEEEMPKPLVIHPAKECETITSVGQPISKTAKFRVDTFHVSLLSEYPIMVIVTSNFFHYLAQHMFLKINFHSQNAIKQLMNLYYLLAIYFDYKFYFLRISYIYIMNYDHIHNYFSPSSVLIPLQHVFSHIPVFFILIFSLFQVGGTQ